MPSVLSLASIGVLPRLGLIGGVLFLMGTAAGLTNIHIAAWCQQRVDQAARGRVLSVLMFAAIGLLPVSLALAGVLAQVEHQVDVSTRSPGYTARDRRCCHAPECAGNRVGECRRLR